MLLAIEKIISSLVTLPGLLLFLNLIIFIYLIKISYSSFMKLISGLIVVIMIITFTGLGVHLFVLPLENYANENSGFQQNELKDIPTVVLGGGINYNVNGSESELSAISKSRLLKGIMMARENKMPLIYTGGVGVGYEDTSEADVALKFVQQFEGIDFIQEKKARTTFENGLKIKQWLEDNQYREIYLVTSAIHMRRSMGVFNRFDVNYIPVVSNYAYSHNLSWLDYLPNRGSLRANMQAIHEWIGIAWYKINGRI
ncbi:MAG: YdcF family protein [Halanaerobiales bacterium]|nr:YdcF family protein [Halanaerobiales bacterium]